jgi:hypothetical protein
MIFLNTPMRLAKKESYPGSRKWLGRGNLVQEEIFTRLRNINESAVKENAGEGTIIAKKLRTSGLVAWTLLQLK